MSDPKASTPGTIPDTELVAFVHGELGGARAGEVRAALARDPALRVRHASLEAADRALCEMLDTAAAPQRVAPGARAWRSVLTAAAVLVVAAVFVIGGGGDATGARNAMVELRAAPRGGASHPLFTAAALDLRWRNLGDGSDWKFLSVGSYPFGNTLASLGKRHAVETQGKVVPLVVSAVLTAPDGTRIPARLCPPGPALEVADREVVQTVNLHDFEVQTSAPPPYLGGRPGDGAWVEDFLWGYRHMPHGKTTRWFPDQPGEWRIELRVECVPPPPGARCTTFEQPLVVTTSLWFTAEVSAWGAAHDGLRARLVVATGGLDFGRAPVAIQIENRSGRTRRYNVTGSTIAKIPQPFHFNLVRVGRDGSSTEAEQRDGVAVITASVDEMTEHPDGQVRTLVVCPDYWRIGGTPVGKLPGDHRIHFVFHFEPSAWTANDTELWMGRIVTGALTIPATKAR